METINKNHFEEVIDRMMMENFPSEFKEKIANMSLRNKRLSILSLLDKDRNLFLRIKSIIGNTKVSKVDHLKDVILMLREYVKVSEVEKKKFGEIMTNLDFVKEMISTLPEEVWSNPNLKWLDPANGVGPFPIMVIYKLMKGLKEWQPDQELRYKHIVENMIYVCEIQAKNMFLYMCVVDPYDEYELNIYTGSFLDEGFNDHMREVWRLEKFDVILGNVPYQETIKGNNRAYPIFNKFVLKSDGISNKMLFVIPSRWLVGGFKMDQYRDIMFNRSDIKLIKHFANSAEIFHGVSISGGVMYKYIDKDYSGSVNFNGELISF